MDEKVLEDTEAKRCNTGDMCWRFICVCRIYSNGKGLEPLGFMGAGGGTEHQLVALV